MIVNEELSALRVTEVRTPSPDVSIKEDEIVADQAEETMMREPPIGLELAPGTDGAEMGLLMIEVPEGRISCMERSINLAEWEVKPVSMTVIKEASDAMNR